MDNRPAEQSAALATLRKMIVEIWQAHRDKDAPEYNECEDAECAWCEQTREALSVLEST